MNQITVSCRKLTKKFGQTLAINDVNLELENGSFLALLGPSGCGKTTLLRMIAGFETPDSGTIEIAGRTAVANGINLPPEKRRVGIVFQDYALFPHLSVGENVAFGLPKTTDKKVRVAEVLNLVGLKGMESRMPHQLSGGEQQRVALARALAPNPEVLLLDEPFSNLDADLRVRIRNEVKEILTAAGATVIFVTHDQEEAMFLGDKVGVMNKGRLEQIDMPETIFHSPATAFVAQFIGTADFIAGIKEAKTVVTEMGILPTYSTIPKGETVKVMIRPDFFDIKPSNDGVGEVTGKIFQGMHYLYKIRLPSGAIIRSLQHHTKHYAAGTRVSLHLSSEHQVACFTELESSHQHLG